MSDWSPPAEDAVTDTNIGEGINDRSMRVSPATQAARDQQAAVLRAKYDSDPAYEPQVLASIEPTVQKGAGGKSKQAVALKNAWTPPSSDAVDATAAPAWTPPEADAAQPSLLDQAITQAKLPWQNETLGSLAKQNAFVRLYDYASKVDDLRQQIHQDNPDLGIMETASLARQQYKDKYGTAPELSVDWSALPKQVYDQITTNPAGFISNLVKGFVVDPELLIQPELGVASRLTGVAKTVAKAGETSATLGAGMAGVSAAEQLQKTGDVEAKPTAQAAAQGAAMGLALSAAHSALDVGLHAVGLKRGADVTPEVETEAAQRFDAKMDDGKPAALAMAETLHEAGMDPRQASKVGASIAPINDALQNVLDSMKGEDHAVDEGQVEQGAVSEREGTGGHVQENGVDRNEPPVVQEEGNQAGGGDQLRGGEAEAPAGPGAVVSLDDYRQRLATTKALDRDTRDELKSAIADASNYVGQGRLTEARVNDALVGTSFKDPESIIEALHGLFKEIEAPQPSVRGRPLADIFAEHGVELQPEPVKAAEPTPENVALTKELLDQHEWSNVKKARDWLTDEQAHGDEYVRAAAEDVYQDMGASKVARSKDVRPFVEQVMKLADERRTIDEGDTAKSSLNLESGKIDPEVLKMMGLAGLGGLGVLAMTHDPTKAIAGAVALGMLPLARRLTTRLTNGVVHVTEKYAGDTRYPTKDIFNRYNAERAIQPREIDKWATAVKALRGDPSGVKAAAENVLTPMRRVAREQRNIVLRDAMQGFEDAKAKLTPTEQAVVEQTRRMADGTFEAAQKAGVLRDYLDNWLPGIYKKPTGMGWDAVVEYLTQEARRGAGGMSTKSRHAMQKVFPDYRTVDQLRAEGKIDLVPITNDPVELVRQAATAIGKAVANKKLIETLKKEPGPITGANERPIPLMVPITTDGAARRIVQGNAILGDKFGLDPEAIRMANKFDIMRSPKDYVAIKHPALEGYRVHKDIADPLKLLFDTSDPGVIMRGTHAIAMASKSIMFAMSPIFHMMNLTQVALPYALRHPSFILNTARAGKNLASKMFEPEMADAMSHGVKLTKGPEDMNPDMAQKFFDWARNSMGDATSGLGRIGEMPVAALQELHKGFNWLLWGVSQPALKMGMYMSEVPAAIAKNARDHLNDPNGVRLKSEEQIKREVSKGINDAFGGQDWFANANDVEPRLARATSVALNSPGSRRVLQTFAIAPDWVTSALRLWTKGLAATLPFTAAKASDSLYRTILWGQVAMYAVAGNMLAKAYTGHSLFDQEDWTYVDRGDGTKWQLNKHLMEGLHLLDNPTKFVINKLGFLPKEALEQAFGREYLTYMNGPGNLSKIQSKITGNSPPDRTRSGAYFGPEMTSNPVAKVLKDFGLPISVKTYQNNPDALLSSTLGFPVFGTPYQLQEKNAVQKAVERANELQEHPELAKKSELDRYGNVKETPDQAEARIHRRFEKAAEQREQQRASH